MSKIFLKKNVPKIPKHGMGYYLQPSGDLNQQAPLGECDDLCATLPELNTQLIDTSRLIRTFVVKDRDRCEAISSQIRCS
jgi:hypothetical protein